jgi:hypothetical protein
MVTTATFRLMLNGAGAAGAFAACASAFSIFRLIVPAVEQVSKL